MIMRPIPPRTTVGEKPKPRVPRRKLRRGNGRIVLIKEISLISHTIIAIKKAIISSTTPS